MKINPDAFMCNPLNNSILMVKYHFFAVLFLLQSLTAARAGETAKSSAPASKPENVILIIGDGMGLAQLTAMLTIAGDGTNLLRFRQAALMRTHSADDFVTDSAAGATALACGTPTTESPRCPNVATVTSRPAARPLRATSPVIGVPIQPRRQLTTPAATRGPSILAVACRGGQPPSRTS